MSKGENMVERIPEEVLEAARLRFKRRLAAVIVNALAESGISTDLVEDRIGMRRGGLTVYVNRLLHGKERGLDSLVDVATATGFEIVVGAQHIPGLSKPNEEGEGK